jgi:hypothetical protein
MPDGEAFSSCGVMGIVRMLFDFESWLGIWEELMANSKGESPYRSRLSC